MITIRIGEFLAPTNTKKKNTNVAVGTAFNTVIKGANTPKRNLLFPHKTPKNKPRMNAIENPIKIL